MLLEANVRNADALKQFLAGYAAQVADPRSKQFITRNVYRWLVNDEESLRLTRRLYDGDPEWARAAFDAGNLYDFVPTAEVEGRLQHIVDALTEITQHRPQLLNRVVTLDVAGAENVFDAFYNHRMQTALVPLNDGEKVIEAFNDGSRWVELTTASALSVEGTAMGHCVGSYANRLGATQFYSLRDSKNRPHITMRAAGKHLAEVKGRQNKPPVGKYIPRLIGFLNKMGFTNTCHDLDRSDIMYSDGRFQRFNVDEIVPVDVDGWEVRIRPNGAYVRPMGSTGPDDLIARYGPTYDPRYSMEFYLKLKLHIAINYSYNFYQEAVAENALDPDKMKDVISFINTTALMATLPNAIQVEQFKGVTYYRIGHGDFVIVDGTKVYKGSLFHGNTSAPLKLMANFAIIFDLPVQREMKIALMSNVPKATAEKLNKRLKISTQASESFNATSPELRRLPDNLKITKTLFIQPACGITKLPDGLRVGRDLSLTNTNVTKIGDNTHIRRVLDLRGSKVRTLPKNLTVGGALGSRLDLRDSLVRSLPDDLTITVTPHRYSYERSAAGGKIIVDRKDIRIPEHLKQFVVFRRPR